MIVGLPRNLTSLRSIFSEGVCLTYLIIAINAVNQSSSGKKYTISSRDGWGSFFHGAGRRGARPKICGAGRGHSESESLGEGERKETRKKYATTILRLWGEAVHGMRKLWCPCSQTCSWAGPPKMIVGRKSVSTT